MKKIISIFLAFSIFIIPSIAFGALGQYQDCDEIRGDAPSSAKVCDLIFDIGWILIIIAIGIAVLMIIVAGIQYMTAGGEDDQIKKAKKTIINGLIGVAIVLLAYFAVSLVKEFVLDRFSLLLKTIV
jgi:amino acid transporter